MAHSEEMKHFIQARAAARESGPVFEMNHPEAEAVVSMGIGGSVGGELTRRRAYTQARMGFVEHRGKGTGRCLRKRGKMEVQKDDDEARSKS